MFRKVAILLSLLALTLLGCVNEEEKARGLLAKAQMMSHDGKPVEAVKELRGLVAAYPETTSASRAVNIDGAMRYIDKFPEIAAVDS